MRRPMATRSAATPSACTDSRGHSRPRCRRLAAPGASRCLRRCPARAFRPPAYAPPWSVHDDFRILHVRDARDQILDVGDQPFEFCRCGDSHVRHHRPRRRRPVGAAFVPGRSVRHIDSIPYLLGTFGFEDELWRCGNAPPSASNVACCRNPPTRWTLPGRVRHFPHKIWIRKSAGSDAGISRCRRCC